MSDATHKGVRSAVMLAGLITLIVTVVRLLGETQGWSPGLFGKEAGSMGAIFGIVWLVVIFGFWFGRRLVRAGKAPASTGRGLLLALIGVVALMGGLGYIGGSLEGEALQTAMGYVAFGGPLLTLLALAAWPAAFAANLLYGVLARVPVIVVQYIAIANDWGTHYEKVHPKMPPMTPDERAFGLMMAQATFWIPFTVLIGTLFALLGAAATRRPTPAG